MMGVPPLLIIYLLGFLGNCIFASASAVGCRLVVETGASRLAKKQADKQPVFELGLS
jgi:hypothetical protein